MSVPIFARINATPWNRVSTAGLACSTAFAALTLYIAFFTGGWMPLVDDANFAVHEAGHPLLAVVSHRLAVYGGTLAQVAFPLICILEFWRRRWAMSCGLSGLWLGESLFNVALYAADARAMQLPLAGFTVHPLHDWNVILLRWGALHHAAAVANAWRGLACVTIALALGFLWLRWLEEHRTDIMGDG